MSSLTRARKYDTVVFRDNTGKEIVGVALEFRSDSMVVGVQSIDRPFVMVTTRRRNGSPNQTRVPNNSLWAVPYQSVLRSEAAGSPEPEPPKRSP